MAKVSYSANSLHLLPDEEMVVTVKVSTSNPLVTAVLTSTDFCTHQPVRINVPLTLNTTYNVRVSSHTGLGNIDLIITGPSGVSVGGTFKMIKTGPVVTVGIGSMKMEDWFMVV